MEQYLKNFKNCRQKEIPFCASVCPFHLDIFDFIEKMKRGSFKAAFKVYRNAVGFPAIASSLCEQPCKGVCPGSGSGGSVELRELEKACIALTEDRSPTEYNLPSKQKKIAVIGAGIAGLACALRLCIKKYEVDIYEKSNRIGGSLWEWIEPEVFLSDIKEQFRHETYCLHLNTEIRTADELADCGYDAVYVATGKGGTDFGLLCQTGETGDRYCTRYGTAGWFAGGGLIGESAVDALAGGLFMGTVIDNFLKTGKLLYPDNAQTTRTCVDLRKLSFAKPVVPENAEGYTPEQARQEAARCIECQCDFCRTDCDLTDYFNKWPLRIRDEIMATTLPGSADVKATPAKRLLSTCSQCGLCRETCPEDIDLGGLILAGRQSMHRQKKVPWVFHDYWLRDMDFANSDRAALNKTKGICRPVYAQEDTNRGTDATKTAEAPDYVFFPGCQLGASHPALVERTYEYLLHKNPEVGLLLRCCGVPAEWAGDEEKHKEEIRTIREQWESLGKPTLILACPTCLKKFKQHMNEIPVTSLYEIMGEWESEGLQAGENLLADKGSQAIMSKTYSVFDACAARHEDGMKQAVRKLATQTGCQLEALPENDLNARCCGYGGQPGVANPAYTRFVAEKRIREGEAPYITYCINCRDIFMEAGKEAVHILELIFGEEPKPLATVSERRENRIRLKKRLLEKFWGEEMEEVKDKPEIKLVISHALAQKLHQKRMLEEDIADVIAFCEQTGKRVWLPEKKAYSGYREKGYMTYWAEYRISAEEGTSPQKDENPSLSFRGPRTYELVNAYSHRMKIELEEVWNGRKTEAGL